MLEFKGSEAYDLSLFEPQVVVPAKPAQKTAQRAQKGAPVRAVPPARKKTAPKKAAPVVKTVEQVKRKTDSLQKTVSRDSESVALPQNVKKGFLLFTVCLMMFSVLVFMRANSDALSDRISGVKSEIAIVDGERVRLNAEMSSKMSRQKVETYAEKKLGMVKAESYQITYLDLSEDDAVVVSGDKSVNGENGFTGKIKELFAYLF